MNWLNVTIFRRHIKIICLFQLDDSAQLGIDAINTLLDSFMGINDAELATLVYVKFQQPLIYEFSHILVFFFLSH